MTEHKALSAFEQAKLQEEVEELRTQLAEREALLAEETKQHECWLFNAQALQKGYNELEKKHREEVEALNLRDALSAEAGQQWLREKQAEALESAAKWFDATEYCAREHGEITAYAENELRRMASELRKQGELK